MSKGGFQFSDCQITQSQPRFYVFCQPRSFESPLTPQSHVIKTHCGGIEGCRSGDPPQAENPTMQNTFLSDLIDMITDFFRNGQVCFFQKIRPVLCCPLQGLLSPPVFDLLMVSA